MHDETEYRNRKQLQLSSTKCCVIENTWQLAQSHRVRKDTLCILHGPLRPRASLNCLGSWLGVRRSGNNKKGKEQRAGMGSTILGAALGSLFKMRLWTIFDWFLNELRPPQNLKNHRKTYVFLHFCFFCMLALEDDSGSIFGRFWTPKSSPHHP